MGGRRARKGDEAQARTKDTAQDAVNGSGEPDYSITSSARSRKASGMVSPIDLAVLRAQSVEGRGRSKGYLRNLGSCRSTIELRPQFPTKYELVVNLDAGLSRRDQGASQFVELRSNP
jgi:hypothetical protein